MHNDQEGVISKILAEEIKDSRGNPTLKVTVWVGGKAGSFSVPSGVSTGTHEAHALPVEEAIRAVNELIAPMLAGKNVFDQKGIDALVLQLDGTKNKKKLGGNAMIGVSVACAKAAAQINGVEVFEYLRTLAEIKPSRVVPQLYMNLINGGKHVPEGGPAFQEYMIVPDTENPEEAIEIGVSVQNTLKEIIMKKLGKDSIIFGDEGGFAARTGDTKAPLYFLHEALKQNSLEGKVRLALDVAATSFYSDRGYAVGDKKISKEELLEIYQALQKEFGLLSVEDPFMENDFESFRILTQAGKTLVVGDDLTVTNIKLLRQAIDQKSISAIIIKPNQIGTLTETLATMQLARENGIELIVSHRSGETDDDFIADLAFAFGCFGLKAGAPSKPERMVKYNRLAKIVNLSD